MAVIHDAQIGKILHKEAAKDEIYLTVPNSIQDRLKKLLDQLGIAPPLLKIEISEESVFWLINKVKDWYEFHHAIATRHPAQINSSYNPKPQRLFTRLSGELVKLDEDDLDAINFLKVVLRKAEIAKNALIFLDASHTASPEIELYISCLSRILNAMERNSFDTVKDEAGTMLDFVNKKILFSYALQNYRCTDQESFNAILSNHASSLQILEEASISYDCAFAVREKVQAIADLMELYLQINNKYHTLPTITYEETLNACHQVMEELSQQLDGRNPLGTVIVSQTLSKQAALLLKKMVESDI